MNPKFEWPKNPVERQLFEDRVRRRMAIVKRVRDEAIASMTEAERAEFYQGLKDRGETLHE